MYHVTALGELLIDFAPVSLDGSGYPTMAAHPGGAPANFLAAVEQYGGRTAMLAKVGADAFGDLLLGTLAQAGIDSRGVVRDPAVFTTLAFVTLDATGDRSFSFARKPGADTRLAWDEVDRRCIDEAAVFHFGTLSLTDNPARDATRRAVVYAKERGKCISFDPNLRLPLWRDADAARAEILWGLRQADVVKLSEEEVDFLWSCGPEAGADRLLATCGVSLALVTLGPQGCLLKNGRGQVALPSPPVQPVDTTGAGDIFGGSAMARLLALDKPPAALDPEELWQIGSFAVTAASLSTETAGGIPSIPEEATVLRRMAEAGFGKPMDPAE